MAKDLEGPRDVSAAFVLNGFLTIIDGRGNVWKYDTGVTEDADGNEIHAPASIDNVAVTAGRDRILALSGDIMWTYTLPQGVWHEGVSIDELLEGEAEKTTDPWKRGHNVESSPAPADTETGTHGRPKGKKKAKEHEEA